MQNDAYLRFIDYAKAFDKSCHEDLFELLSNLGIFVKILE